MDVLERKTLKLVIALSHYHKHSSGDMIPDPDMTMVVYFAINPAAIIRTATSADTHAGQDLALQHGTEFSYRSNNVTVEALTYQDSFG